MVNFLIFLILNNKKYFDETLEFQILFKYIIPTTYFNTKDFKFSIKLNYSLQFFSLDKLLGLIFKETNAKAVKIKKCYFKDKKMLLIYPFKQTLY